MAYDYFDVNPRRAMPSIGFLVHAQNCPIARLAVVAPA